MIELISKDKDILKKLSTALHESTGDLLDLDSKVIAEEFLSYKRAKEQIDLFIKTVNEYEKYDFKNKKFLEVGCGVGSSLIVAKKDYSIDAFGVEPSSKEFSSFKEISLLLFKEHNLSDEIIINSTAESLPFESETFDLVYSTNVLEHVNDPVKVLNESYRVLKRGGFLQFVIPNYFSFWEGHYGVFWPCITNKTLGKIYATIIGKNPKYVDSLQLINPGYLKNILKDLENKIEVIGWGKEVFKNRLENGNYSDWASLQKIRPLVEIVQKIKLSSLISSTLNLFEMYTPIVLTFKKLK